MPAFDTDRAGTYRHVNPIQNIVLVAIILFFAVLEIRSGRHKEFHATADDTKLELFMFLALLAVSQPLHLRGHRQALRAGDARAARRLGAAAVVGDGARSCWSPTT